MCHQGNKATIEKEKEKVSMPIDDTSVNIIKHPDAVDEGDWSD